MPHDLLWHRLRFLIHGTSCIALKDSLWFLDGYTAPHYPKLHYTALRWATSHYTTKHHHNTIPGTPHYITLHCATLRWTTLHDTTPQYTTIHHTYTTLHYIIWHYTTLRGSTPHDTTPNTQTLHCTLDNVFFFVLRLIRSFLKKKQRPCWRSCDRFLGCCIFILLSHSYIRIHALITDVGRVGGKALDVSSKCTRHHRR